jgi:hypothetical protein
MGVRSFILAFLRNAKTKDLTPSALGNAKTKDLTPFPDLEF